jgi:hypothetical protein
MSLDIENTKFKPPPKEPPQNTKINTEGSLFKIIIIIILNLNLNLKTHTPHQS